ncbi:MAG: NADH-quinone oxidoreductase subunit A [Chitinophagaceae bacterium]
MNLITFLDIQSSLQYKPILMQVIVAITLILLLLVVTHLLGPLRKGKRKLENYECGIEQKGNARIPIAVKYFIVAIIFVLFDVEIVFFYPYAINFNVLGWSGFIAVVIFIAFFLIGFLYIMNKKVIDSKD